MGMILLRNENTGADLEFSDDPDVLEFYGARGWKPAPKDETPPIFVPTVTGPVDDPSAWVEMSNPTTGATHSFPNNTDALSGALDAGWVLPVPPEEEPPAPDETPEPESASGKTPPKVKE